MKLQVKLTLDGLVRALRGIAHDLAGRIEAGETDESPPPAKSGGKRDAIRP